MTIHSRSQSGGLRQKVKAGQTKNNNFGKKYKAQRCRMNDKTWKYLDINKNDRDVCLVGRCGIYWSVQDRREICFQVRAQVRWTIRDREGVSQWKKVLRLEPYRFLLLFWNPPKYGYPNIYLDGLESCKLLIIVIKQVQNILIQSLETHDQSCISLLKADCKLHRWWHFHLFIIRRYKHINTHNITERNRRIISCEIFSLRLYGTLPYWRYLSN